MLMTDAVMSPHQPSLQIREDEVDDRQILVGNPRVTALGDGEVLVPALSEIGVAGPVVGNDHGVWRNRSLNEAAKRLRATVRHDGEPDSPRIPFAFALVELGARLALAHLYRTGDKDLVMDAPALAARPSADIGFIDLDVLTGHTANPVLIGTYHASAELVENLEGGLVARQSPLPLKLHGRPSWRLTGHPVGGPEPNIQRRMRAFHHRSGRQPSIAVARSASKDARAFGDAIRLANCSAVQTDKPLAPTGFLKVSSAGRIVREKPLELRERRWKREGPRVDECP